MEPLDPDNMTDEERRRAENPLAAWVIVIAFAVFLILGTIRYGFGDVLYASLGH